MSLLENSPEQLSFFPLDFEAAVISAIRKVFSDSVIPAYNFHCSTCLWRNLRNIGLKVECKENEQVRLICRLCAALAYLIVNKVEVVWFIIMENVAQNEKLTLSINTPSNGWRTRIFLSRCGI